MSKVVQSTTETGLNRTYWGRHSHFNKDFSIRSDWGTLVKRAVLFLRGLNRMRKHLSTQLFVFLY